MSSKTKTIRREMNPNVIRTTFQRGNEHAPTQQEKAQETGRGKDRETSRAEGQMSRGVKGQESLR